MSTKHDEPSEVETAASEARRPQDWSPKERMQFVLDADGLGDQELGELLRRRGVHREQLDAWRIALYEAFVRPTASRRSPEGKRIKQLEREVARKDKALAETAALLVLQKKTFQPPMRVVVRGFRHARRAADLSPLGEPSEISIKKREHCVVVDCERAQTPLEFLDVLAEVRIVRLRSGREHFVHFDLRRIGNVQMLELFRSLELVREPAPDH